jgi:ABC-type polysaccharide/polyol phosphate transport system ATPase subunit
MGVPSIVVEGVGKRFELHQARSGSFRELLARRSIGAARPEKDFWALEDISFTVEPGHPLAIIGHNGSGKSTLLKLLTGILKPTRGKIDVRGRIGALIEVGAGFHPDLTGRENVYLNGSILGATKKEIDKRFDHIVAFAGLEKFIDTPVKRYSSGMHMRLGFSIAAHLEPEILLIDEVLAVGDAQFQSRCIGHLKRFVAQGGSVVFVSHTMSQVELLCDRVLWLDHGRALGFGEAAPLIAQYEALVSEREDGEFQKLYPEEWAARKREQEEKEARAERLAWLLEQRDTARVRRAQVRTHEENQRREREAALKAEREAALADQAQRLQDERERLAALEPLWHASALARQAHDAERAARKARDAWLADPLRGRITGVRLLGQGGTPTERVHVEDELRLELDYRIPRPLPRPTFCIEFFRESDDLHLFTTSNFDHQFELGPLPEAGTICVRLPFLAINAGRHYLRLRLYTDWRIDDWDAVLEDSWERALTFEVEAGRFGHGAVYMPVCWEGSVDAGQ